MVLLKVDADSAARGAELVRTRTSPRNGDEDMKAPPLEAHILKVIAARQEAARASESADLVHPPRTARDGARSPLLGEQEVMPRWPSHAQSAPVTPRDLHKKVVGESPLLDIVTAPTRRRPEVDAFDLLSARMQPLPETLPQPLTKAKTARRLQRRRFNDFSVLPGAAPRIVSLQRWGGLPPIQRPEYANAPAKPSLGGPITDDLPARLRLRPLVQVACSDFDDRHRQLVGTAFHSYVLAHADVSSLHKADALREATVEVSYNRLIVEEPLATVQR